MKHCIQALSILAIATTCSFAQDAPKKRERPTPEAAFKKLDTNSDGSLSLEEFKASPMGKKNPEKAEAAYKKMDADSKDGVSLEEFKAARTGKGKGEGKGKKGGKGKKAADAPAEAPAEAPAAK